MFGGQKRAQCITMDGNGNESDGSVRVTVTVGRCPRCEICGRVVRVRGVGSVGVWCAGCMAGALPFVGLLSDGDFRGAVREYGEGVGSRAGDFQGVRFDPFDEGTRGVTRDLTLRGCSYMGGIGWLVV